MIERNHFEGRMIDEFEVSLFAKTLTMVCITEKADLDRVVLLEHLSCIDTVGSLK